MQLKNTQYMLAKSVEFAADPIAAIVRKATEVGVVVPSLLKAGLEAGGFRIEDDPQKHAEHGYREFEHLERVLVHDKTGNVIAMGAASDFNEALLHAVLGYLRELEVASAQPKK